MLRTVFQPYLIVNKTFCEAEWHIKITYLIFSFNHFILGVYAFNPVVGVISLVSCIDQGWLGICDATAEQKRHDKTDNVVILSAVETDKHVLDNTNTCLSNFRQNYKTSFPIGSMQKVHT